MMRRMTAVLSILFAPIAATGGLAQTPANPTADPDASPLLFQPHPTERPIVDPVPVAPGTETEAQAVERLQPTIPAQPGPPGTGRVPTDAPAGFLPEGTNQGPESDTPAPPSPPAGITVAEAASWIGFPVLSVENEVVGTVRDIVAFAPEGPADRIVIERHTPPGGLTALPVAQLDKIQVPESLRLRLSADDIADAAPFAYTDEVYALIGEP